MELKVKEKLRRHWLVAFSVILCSVLIVSAYAITTLWSTSTTVTISTSSPYIKVYLGGTEVTSISFGNLVPGSVVTINGLLVLNTHPNATFVNINWGSTLNTVTDKITDMWSGFPTSLNPGEGEYHSYRLTVASDCPLGTYSWTLYLIPPA